MTAHTPGPWRVSRRDGQPHGDSDNLGWDWDDDFPHNCPPEPMRGIFALEADARMAAAAPDLFEALKGAIGALEFSRDYHKDLGNEEQAFAQDRLDAALAALSKARPSLTGGVE